LLSSAQTLTLTYRNNGPLNAPAGGTVSTVVPAGFAVGTMPLGCSKSGAGPTTVICTAGIVNNGNAQSFAIPLTMPATAASGNFPIAITPPTGFGDAVPANNNVNVPYNVVAPFADLAASKTKSPGGPQPSGTLVTTTLTVTNEAASASAASYTVAQPLRIVDYLKPEEVSGGTVSAVSPNWSCVVTTGVVPPAFVSAAQTTRVACQSTDVGSLAIGAGRSVSFSSALTLGGSTSPISLPNTACTGGRALSALGLAAAAGPQPPDTATGNDCANDSANLVVTPVASGLAQASVQKLSSVDNATFVDAVGAAPTLASGANTIYWRMVVTTPSVATNPAQTIIPTLRLADTLPGRLNVTSTGSPAPGYVTPAITVTTTPNTFGACPSLVAGNSDALNCSFSNVPAGTTITINLAVQRPMASGTMTNTATLSSPDAVLSAAAGGQLTDAAAVIVSPRVDVAMNTKSVAPATPRIGELVQFTMTAQNLGPDDVTAAGQFTVTDTFNVTPTPLLVGYEVLSASGPGMDCTASNLATGAISCTNTGAVPRYTVQTITISARVKKPSGVLPVSGNVYTNQVNTANVTLSGGYCEFKTETVTNALVSAACNDANATSNNSKTVTFDVQVPAIDMKQRKERMLPGTQTAFGLGDQLHYRFRVQANGPSRAEGIVMTDRLVVPAGYSVEMDGVGAFPRTVTALAINAAAAESGYTLDASKVGTVRCAQASANADIVCNLSAVAANNFMDAAREVNFELLFNVTPTTATAPVSFGNRAFVCADETAVYESSGACSDVPATAGNNLASVNDTVFPKNDLEVVSKTTVTPSPVDINQPIRFDIVMRNNGTSAGVKMRLRDTLPTGLEWVNTGAQLPVVSPNAGSASTVSGPLTVSASVPADGTGNVCFISNGITALTDLTQQQDITCDISGSFPAGAANTITLTLYARAKGNLYDGSAGAPYLAGRTNTAAIFPGKDGTGSDIAIDINAANNSKTSTVQIRNAQLGGRTFLDLNNNGDQNGTILSADQGLGNVTITLTGTDLYGYPVSRSVTTDNAALGAGSTRGDYLFTNLPPSSTAGYTITQTQPAGYGNGTPVPNTVRTVRNGVSTGTSGPFAVSNTTGPDTSVISGVRLAGGGNGVQFDFPELQKPSFSGFVYLDANNDGVKNVGEAGINGVTMTLIGCRAGANGVIDTVAPIGAGPVTCAGDDQPVSLTTSTATDATFGAGFYRFALDEPGRYSVIEQVAQPTVAGVATLRGKTTAGSVDLVTSAPGANDGGTRGTVNTTAANAGGVPGVLQEIAATVPTSQIRDVLINNSAAISVDNNFGETLPASLGGVVYTEKGVLNSNYGAGSDWPFPGVAVLLTGTDDLGRAVSIPGATDGNGAYLFPNLRPGTYQVTKTNPGGIVNEVGGAFPGKDAGNVTRGTRADDNTINAINLVSGAAVTNTNFAVTNGPAPVVPITATTIAGIVYVDRDRNNALDSNDPTRIAGVTVKLVRGVTCDTGAVLQTTATAADGSYSFSNVNVGESYLVCETQPAGYGNGNAKGTPGSNTIIVSNLTAAGSTDNHFGELLGSIAGLVYLDSNSNGQRDTSEPGISGVTVTLTGADVNGLAITRSLVTDASGNYRFDDLLAAGPAGYTVTEQAAQPNAPGTQTPTLNGITTAGTIAGVTSGAATPVSSLPSAVRGIALPVGGQSINNNFGEVLTALAPDMVVTKIASKAVFTEGYQAVYSLNVRNAGGAPTVGSYTVVDSLPATGLPAKWSIEAASGAGWSCAISADRQQVSCDSSQVLQPGQNSPSAIQLTVNIAQGASAFSPLRNGVSVSGGGEPQDKKPQPAELAAPKSCSPQAELNVCQLATPVQVAVGLNGHVWIDGGAKNVLDSSDKLLPGWVVEIYDGSSGKSLTDLVRGGSPTRTATTDANGFYQVCGLEPGINYRVLFRDPASRIAFPGVVTNESGRVTGADYFSQVRNVEGFQVLQVALPTAAASASSSACNVTAPEQSLPIDPNGVVYDSKTRQPVAGAAVTLVVEGICPGYDPKLYIINYETYAKDAAGNPSMTTGSDGFYKFLLSGDPGAPKSCNFRLNVTQPVGYKPPPSSVILPKGKLATPAGPGVFNVQPQKVPPIGNQDTSYYFELLFGLNHREVFNNHIPLDPLIPGKLVLTKQGDRRLAEVGDTVLYTITVRLLEGDPVAQATVRDRLPAGFTLVPGTVRVNNVPAPNPLGGLGPVLGFNLGPMQPNVEARVTYRVRVGVGAGQGDGINRAQAHACQTVAACLNAGTLLPIAGSVPSNEGLHKVEVSGGVFTDQACVLGKVFVDCNNNHVQDPEELGIPGVRLYFENGRSVVTDSEGKYSYCGLTPRSHVLGVDRSTLPTGSRLTTTSNRNLGDANSLFLDLKNGELHRADFAEGSCSNPVMEQVKARRAQGEVRSVETEKSTGPALRFQSKPLSAPKQGTDSANQPLVLPRQGGSDAR
jgi:uncharacterized repeat protein (TIGR01451 family)